MSVLQSPELWQTLLGEVRLDRGEFLLYLDPHSLDNPESPTGAVVGVTDRWQLRRLLEQRLRGFRSDEPPLLVHVRIPDVASTDSLPFDARELACRVLDVRLPVSALEDVRQLPPRAVQQLAVNRGLPERLAAVARELTGLAWPPAPENGITAVARLVRHTGPALRALLLPGCPSGAAHRILAADDPFTAIGDVLLEWSKAGPTHAEEAGLRAASEDISLLIGGRQVAVPGTEHLPPTLPRVLRDAIRSIDALPEVERLVAQLGPAGDSLEAWTAFADQWAKARWTLAALPPSPETAEVARGVWDRWEAQNAQWQEWLQQHYATSLSRTVLNPASVHRVAPFLSSHSVDAGSKLLLLVLDGLGVAQWQQIVHTLGVTPIEDRRVLAGLPTMTTISRQAIFAGALATTFADTIDRTDTEPARWRSFWTQQGLAVEQIHYRRTGGADAAAWTDPPDSAIVSGMAVNALDDLMHGVSVNGDHQFYAGVTTWLAGCFLERALDWADRRSVQVWVTADHGNLPCVGLGEPIPEEGVRVIGRGLRSRMYNNELQREAAVLKGTRWTPPGFPGTAGAPLFAPGRTYFRRSGGVITHGGLSLDEVVVPLARIA